MKRNCNGHHNYGPWEKIGTEYQRTCKCCNITTTYPETDEKITEIEKQEDAKKLLKILLHKDTEIINSSDSYMSFISCLIDGLHYLDLHEDTQEGYIESIISLNAHYHSEEKYPERYNIILNFIDYLKVYFRKEKVESLLGKNTFPEAESEILENAYDTINDQINSILAEIYDQNKEKSHLVGR